MPQSSESQCTSTFLHLTPQKLPPKRKLGLTHPSSDNEEYPRAYVSIQDSSKGRVSPQDIQDWVAPRVSKHKRLAGGVSFVDAVPKLPSGKIVRKLMREWAKRDALAIEEKGLKARM